MEITKSLCLSTAHISEATRDLLQDGEPGFTVWKAEYGFFMSCHPLENGHRLPADLACAMGAALKAECDFLRLDADGPIEEGLATYEW